MQNIQPESITSKAYLFGRYPGWLLAGILLLGVAVAAYIFDVDDIRKRIANISTQENASTGQADTESMDKIKKQLVEAERMRHELERLQQEEFEKRQQLEARAAKLQRERDEALQKAKVEEEQREKEAAAAKAAAEREQEAKQAAMAEKIKAEKAQKKARLIEEQKKQAELKARIFADQQRELETQREVERIREQEFVQKKIKQAEESAALIEESVKDKENSVFNPDPCNGPTAKFLSTCN